MNPVQFQRTVVAVFEKFEVPIGMTTYHKFQNGIMEVGLYDQENQSHPLYQNQIALVQAHELQHELLTALLPLLPLKLVKKAL